MVYIYSGLIWQRQTKNQSSVIRLNINYGTASVDAWFKILMLVTKTVNEKKKNVRINAKWHFTKIPIDIIFELMKPASIKPFIQTQLKTAQTKKKRKKNMKKRKKQRQLFNDQKSQLINRFKCNSLRCSNYEKGQCYEKNNKHYKLKFSNINV